MELGPRDLKEKQAVLVRRDTGAKRAVKLSGLVGEVAGELEAIQKSLLQRATAALKKSTHEASTLAEVKNALAQHGGIVRVPWSGKPECEARLNEETGGKILNVPLDQKAKGRCPVCSEDGAAIANFGKSY